MREIARIIIKHSFNSSLTSQDLAKSQRHKIEDPLLILCFL